MDNFKPITGDDNPILTIALREIPKGYHFKDLVFPERTPLSLAVKDRLCDYAERFYRNYEILGISIADWFIDLQLALDENIDNFEKFLEVYDDDIAKPVLGREVTHEHDESESTSGSSATNDKIYDLPIDNGGMQETTRNVGDGSSSGSRTLKTTDKEYMSDIGVTNNWEKLNGFLDYNPSMEKIFKDYFKDCFTMYDTMKW